MVEVRIVKVQGSLATYNRPTSMSYRITRDSTVVPTDCGVECRMLVRREECNKKSGDGGVEDKRLDASARLELFVGATLARLPHKARPDAQKQAVPADWRCIGKGPTRGHAVRGPCADCHVYR